MFQDCQETYEAVIRFYHDSLNTWASSHQTASDLKPFLEKPSGLILTKQLLDNYESYKDDTVNDAVNKVRNQGYKLSTKKATMLFWFFVYRIVKNAKYTTPDGKTLTAESFVKVLGTGKGISHNTLNDYDTELSSRRGGAPGEIIINEKLKYEANDIYSTLRDRIMNE